MRARFRENQRWIDRVASESSEGGKTGEMNERGEVRETERERGRGEIFLI